ncbi:MAG: MBL fold metallo-hydrolase [Pseudomonadota bacterium]
MTQNKAATMRILRPSPHIMAFYDGRIEGRRLHSPEPNWLDDGGYTLGTCSYAIVDGDDALIYDTHMSIDHARAIRLAVEATGATNIRVVLSHHHLDHIAGNAVFADCEILSNAATRDAMEAERQAAEDADPPVAPVIMPTRVFDTALDLYVGGIEVLCQSFDIHSRDGLCLLIPETGEFLAGDTLEDTVTYVAEPDRLEVHLPELDRMAGLDIRHILPNHGAEEIIAAGGYSTALIGATSRYVQALLDCRADCDRAALPLKEFVRDDIASGALVYHQAYEPVHARNVSAVQALPG